MNFDFDNKHPFRWESIRFNNRGKTGHTTKKRKQKVEVGDGGGPIAITLFRRPFRKD